METKEEKILTIDYNMSFKYMIDAGHYDWTPGFLALHPFSIEIEGEGTEEVEYKTFHFNRNISSEEAKCLIEEDGWEVAKTEHLLAFGAKNPDEQRRYSIVALGSDGEVGGRRGVLIIGMCFSERFLDLAGGGDWRPFCRFLAVREVG